MGHVHVYTRDTEAQKKFWVGALDAQETKLGDLQVFKLPGVLVLVQKADARAGTEGSVINHIGLKVRNLSATLVKLESAHIPIVSRTPPQAMVLAPDDIRVELTEDPAISGATINHHIHFYAPDVSAMQKWYAVTFGAIPGKRGRFEADDLPGVNLTFTRPGSWRPKKWSGNLAMTTGPRTSRRRQMRTWFINSRTWPV